MVFPWKVIYTEYVLLDYSDVSRYNKAAWKCWGLLLGFNRTLHALSKVRGIHF
jgi:hypothetical protein